MLGAGLLWAGCREETFDRNASVALRFSHGGLDFDTLLAPIGSGTAHFAAYNPSSQNIVIQQITLCKGNESPFLININGQPHKADEVRLAKFDSILIFVEARQGILWEITDSVRFIVGGTEQHFPLRAYVSTAAAIPDTIFNTDVHFTNAEPYLFLGNAVVARRCTAVVDAGSQLLFVRDKGLQIDGHLRVQGGRGQPALFAHARHRNAWYADKKGQWQGIFISGTGSIEWADIRGAAFAVAVVDTASARAEIALRQCSISFAQRHLCIKGRRVVVDSSNFSGTIYNDTIDLAGDANPVCL